MGVLEEAPSNGAQPMSEAKRARTAAERALTSEREECGLKLYLPFFVNTQASKYHYNCETKPVVFYEGNLNTRMMAFRFWLLFDPRTESLRPPP
jgi:hypothetical protein